HRSLVARSGFISRSFKLLKLRRFPSASDAASVQRSRWEEPVLPHVECVGPRVAQIVRGRDRELSAAGWVGANPRKVAALLWRGEDRNDEARMTNVEGITDSIAV